MSDEKKKLPNLPGLTTVSKLEAELEINNQTAMTVMTESRAVPFTAGEGPFLYDVRKEKNRKLANELILGSVSQGIDFFIIFEENKKFYFKPVSKEVKVLYNNIHVPHGSTSPELVDGDIIAAEKAKYVINKNVRFSVEDARKTIAQKLLQSTVHVQSQVMEQSAQRYEALKKELSQEQQGLIKWDSLRSEKINLREKILEIQARILELDNLDLENKIKDQTEKIKKIKDMAELEYQQYVDSKEKVEKQKELDQMKRSKEANEEKERIEKEEKELEQKMLELQEKKKRLRSA